MPSILQTQREIIERLDRLEFGGCCPENTGLFDDTVSTDITPGEGDPPATWGNQEVADWDDWQSHLCGAASRYVDYLADSADQMQLLVSQGAYVIATIAAILGLLSGAGLLLVISYGAAAASFNAVAQLAGTTVFGESASAIRSNRNKIICAVKEDNLRQAMSEVLSSTAWLFYKYVQWENATNILWEGGQPGGENLPPATPMACPDCVEIWELDEVGLDFAGWSPMLVESCTDERWPSTVDAPQRVRPDNIRCSDDAFYGVGSSAHYPQYLIVLSGPWYRSNAYTITEAGNYYATWILTNSSPSRTGGFRLGQNPNDPNSFSVSDSEAVGVNSVVRVDTDLGHLEPGTYYLWFTRVGTSGVTGLCHYSLHPGLPPGGGE